jgi:hypothetical protein
VSGAERKPHVWLGQKLNLKELPWMLLPTKVRHRVGLPPTGANRANPLLFSKEGQRPEVVVLNAPPDRMGKLVRVVERGKSAKRGQMLEEKRKARLAMVKARQGMREEVARTVVLEPPYQSATPEVGSGLVRHVWVKDARGQLWPKPVTHECGVPQPWACVHCCAKTAWDFGEEEPDSDCPLCCPCFVQGYCPSYAAGLAWIAQHCGGVARE